MTTQDLDRIRFVTRHFLELQGLRSTVPFGLILLFWGAAKVLHSLSLVILEAIAVIWFLLRPLSTSYYRKRFGEVEPFLELPEAWSSRWFYLAMALLIGGIFVAFTLVGVHDFARLEYTLFSVGFLATWLWRRARLSQIHCLLLGGLLLGLAVLGGSPSSMPPALAGTGMATLLAGAAYIAAGLLDHLQLVRALGRQR